MGVVSQLKVESLRIEESQMLASMLCHATMFVTPTEFHNLLAAVQQRSWARMDRPAVLLLVREVLSGETPATPPQPSAPTPSTLRKGSSFREQARARPPLQKPCGPTPRAKRRAKRHPAAMPHCLMSRRLAPALTERPSRRPCQVRNIARGRSDLPNPLNGERGAGGATPTREAPSQSVPASPSQQAWRTPAPTGPPTVAATAPVPQPEPVRRPRQRRYSWAGNLNLRSFKVPPQPAPLRAHCTFYARSVHARCVCTTAHPPHTRRTSATQRTA
jgi:hypothetical protein